MILMFGFLDRVDDILAMLFVIEWAFRGARWWYRRKHPTRDATARLNSSQS